MPYPPVEYDMEEDDLVSLSQNKVRRKGHTGRDRVFEKPFHRSYSTRGAEIKLLSDALKSSKKTATRKRDEKKNNKVSKIVSPLEKIFDVKVEGQRKN